MSHKINEIGNRYGKLLVIREAQSNKRGLARWLCKCDCGNETIQNGADLRNNKVVSCGCYQREELKNRRLIHGEYKSTEFKTWIGILSRCENKNNKDYIHYGGRGIKICDKWRNSFQEFLNDMGRKPFKNYSIERKDYNGDYCPENCCWANTLTQVRNSRRNLFIDYNGEIKCLSAWAEEIGIKYGTLSTRIHQLNWPIEKALTTPVRKKTK